MRLIGGATWCLLRLASCVQRPDPGVPREMRHNSRRYAVTGVPRRCPVRHICAPVHADSVPQRRQVRSQNVRPRLPHVATGEDRGATHSRDLSCTRLRQKLADRRGQADVLKQVFLDQFVHNPFVLFPTFYALKSVLHGGTIKQGVATCVQQSWSLCGHAPHNGVRVECYHLVCVRVRVRVCLRVRVSLLRPSGLLTTRGRTSLHAGRCGSPHSS